jgi:hypothetical protein
VTTFILSRAFRSVVAVATIAQVAHARPHVRRHFEPTDLELEPVGTSEIDLEVGMMRSGGPWRVVAPDFEADVGVLPWLELDVDGAFAIEGATDAPFRFDHSVSDPLWLSAKLGLWDVVDEASHRSYAFGAQLGPRLPTFAGGRGLGAETLLLGGVDFGAQRFALNLGGFVEPAPLPRHSRPIGVQCGLDWALDVDQRAALNAGVASVVFVTHDPTQLSLSFGPSYEPAPWLHLSLTGLVGFFPGSDRYGLLLGVAPRLPLWKS